jgi:hypothetical protein
MPSKNPKTEHAAVDHDLLLKNGFTLGDKELAPCTVPKGTTWYRVEAGGIIGYGGSWQEAYDSWFRARP